MYRKWNSRAVIPHMIIVFLLSFVSFSGAAPAVNIDRDGVALKGYDPVAYFTLRKAVKGSEEHTFSWKGASWWFADKEHRDLFKEDPEMFAPQYGGY